MGMGPKALATCLTGTIAGTAVPLGDLTGYTTAHAKATRAVITVITDAVSYTYNGTTPTASVGHVIPANGTVVVDGADKVAALKFIKVTNNAVITVTLEQD